MSAISENHRARFDFEILDTYEAGLSLLGHEVKSIKNRGVSLVGSYAVIRGGEVWLLNLNIPPYQQNNVPAEYDPSRTRRLLLQSEEIRSLSGRLNEKGLSLIPLEVFLSRGFIKIKLGLARAKKTRDKREDIKKRESRREMRD